MNRSARGKSKWRLSLVAVVAAIAGFIGGIFGIFIVNDYFSLVSDRSRQVILEESSAIIEVAKKLEPSVVSITTENLQLDIFGRSQSAPGGAGTGIIIREDGLILTNKHVVSAGTTNVSVVLSDGSKLENAQVVARDPLLDLAYIKVNASGLKPAELGDSDQVVVGQRVIAVGNALGEFENTVTSGIISGLGRPIVAQDASEAEQLQDLLQTDAAINPGNSGGPLVDVNGRVIGVNTAIAGGAENIGFAIPINQAKSGITSVESTGKLSKPFLGVRFIPLNEEIAKANDLPVSAGAYLLGDAANPAVLPDTPAARAGLKQGDVIVRVDGEKITEDRSLTTIIGRHKPGDQVKLTVVRDGKELDLEATLSELPQS